MQKKFPLQLLAAVVGAALLAGCGDAETTIVEQDPIDVPDDGHDHGDDDHATGAGRLAVLSAGGDQALIFDLHDDSLLDSFSLSYPASAIAASPGLRYAVLVSRNDDHVGFLDGGVWQEDHGDHLHPYAQAPALSDYSRTATRPTHTDVGDDQLAIFYDGNAELGLPASVEVITDHDIANETAHPAAIHYSMAMHGVAKPRGEYVLATVRRADAESTSNAKVLPDQVGVYHLHGDDYELDVVLDEVCPDLHGAAQNHDNVVFGCRDGVLVATETATGYSASKISNIAALNGARIGTIFGNEESASFIGVANGEEQVHLVSIAPHENAMSAFDWQPAAGRKPVAYSFANDGSQFLVLDDHAALTVLSAHAHGDHLHWEEAGTIQLNDGDLSAMPEGGKFALTVAQDGHYAYVADPIAKHVLKIDLETVAVVGDIELDTVPAGITWLGIAEGHDDHAH